LQKPSEISSSQLTSQMRDTAQHRLEEKDGTKIKANSVLQQVQR